MTNPTNQQIAAGLTLVNDTLRKAPEVNLDMKSTEWNEKNICGTPACFAGMYMALNGLKRDEKSWTNGSKMIAKACGFGNSDEMRHWAETNPELWGNESGYFMFSRSKAFVPDAERDKLRCDDKYWDKIPLSQVISWIDGVIGRLNA